MVISQALILNNLHPHATLGFLTCAVRTTFLYEFDNELSKKPSVDSDMT